MELLSWSSFKTSSDAGPSVSCHRYQPERRTLIAGLADGHLAYWTRRKDGGSQGSSDAKPFLLHAHAGGVRCVLLVESEGLGLEGCLLFTGGADRTIRVWDPTLRDAKKACVQTLRAHGGTVAALAYCEGLLVSASTDKTIKVWRVDEGRELMLYPWLSLRQTLADLDGWANALALHLGESSALYVGDEHGTISVRARSSLTAQFRRARFHLRRLRRSRFRCTASPPSPPSAARPTTRTATCCSGGGGSRRRTRSASRGSSSCRRSTLSCRSRSTRAPPRNSAQFFGAIRPTAQASTTAAGRLASSTRRAAPRSSRSTTAARRGSRRCGGILCTSSSC